MTRHPDETAAEWYERAIVANSIAAAAADDLAEMPNANATARRVIAKRAEEAATDLGRALEAFIAERKANRERG